MYASSCRTYPKNSLTNTTSAQPTDMVGYSSKSSADATASLNLDDLQTTSYAPGLKKLTLMKPPTTPGLWCHKWRPIQFVLLVDDFGIEYVGKEHALHLLKTLEKNYEITTDWEGKKIACIDLSWNYHTLHADRTCRISLKDYIDKVLLKYNHPVPKKPQLSPHKNREISYGNKEQLAPEEDTSPPLDTKAQNASKV